MANNPKLYNAVISGATGGTQQRWITDPTSSDYEGFVEAVVVLATAVDEAIETIEEGVSDSQAQLMQSIVQGVYAGRYIQSVNDGNYAPIIGPIVALWTEVQGSLEGDIPGDNGGGMITTVFVDPQTPFPPNLQDGSAVNPFGSVQDAVDYFGNLDEPGTIYLSGGDYQEEDVDIAALQLSIVSAEGPGRARSFGAITGAGCQLTLVGLAEVGSIALTNVGGTPILILDTTDVSGNVSCQGGPVELRGPGPEVDENAGDIEGTLSAGTLMSNGYSVQGRIAVQTVLLIATKIGSLTLAGAGPSKMISCSWHGVAEEMNGTGDNVLLMDGSTYAELFQSEVVVGPEVLIQTLNLHLPVEASIDPGILAAGATDDITVDLSTTIYAGALPDDFFVVASNDPIAGGGGIIGAWVTALDTLDVRFIGPTSGGGQTFSIIRLGIPYLR